MLIPIQQVDLFETFRGIKAKNFINLTIEQNPTKGKD